MKVLTYLVALMFVLSACTSTEPEWDSNQQAVFDAMQNYVKHVQGKDLPAMWKTLSPDAKEVYVRELAMAVGRWTLARSALDNPESEVLEPQRRALEKELAQIPENPKKMSAENYYVWKFGKALTPEAISNTARVWERTNIESIEIKGTNASVTLKSGNEKRISWSRHDGVWKFDGKSSTMRELKNARERENRK